MIDDLDLASLDESLLIALAKDGPELLRSKAERLINARWSAERRLHRALTVEELDTIGHQLVSV
jgi:hypothetical protein